MCHVPCATCDNPCCWPGAIQPLQPLSHPLGLPRHCRHAVFAHGGRCGVFADSPGAARAGSVGLLLVLSTELVRDVRCFRHRVPGLTGCTELALGKDSFGGVSRPHYVGSAQFALHKRLALRAGMPALVLQPAQDISFVHVPGARGGLRLSPSVLHSRVPDCCVRVFCSRTCCMQ